MKCPHDEWLAAIVQASRSGALRRALHKLTRRLK